MPDKRSIDNDNQETADFQHEENVFKNASDADHDSDHLQEPFNDLENPSSSVNENVTAPESHEEAGDAFNDLANAFSADGTAPTASKENEVFVSRLEGSLPEFESTTAQAQNMADADDLDLAFLNEADKTQSTADAKTEDEFDISHLHNDDISSPDAAPVETVDEPEPELDSNALFENEAPVYADLSSEDPDEQRSSSQTIAFVMALLLIIAAGIYWYTSGSDQQQITNTRTTSLQNDVAQAADRTADQAADQTAGRNSPTVSDQSAPATRSTQPVLKKTTHSSSQSTANKIIKTSPAANTASNNAIKQLSHNNTIKRPNHQYRCNCWW